MCRRDPRRGQRLRRLRWAARGTRATGRRRPARGSQRRCCSSLPASAMASAASRRAHHGQRREITAKLFVEQRQIAVTEVQGRRALRHGECRTSRARPCLLPQRRARLTLASRSSPHEGERCFRRSSTSRIESRSSRRSDTRVITHYLLSNQRKSRQRRLGSSLFQRCRSHIERRFNHAAGFGLQGAQSIGPQVKRRTRWSRPWRR